MVFKVQSEAKEITDNWELTIQTSPLKAHLRTWRTKNTKREWRISFGRAPAIHSGPPVESTSWITLELGAHKNLPMHPEMIIKLAVRILILVSNVGIQHTTTHACRHAHAHTHSKTLSMCKKKNYKKSGCVTLWSQAPQLLVPQSNREMCWTLSDLTSLLKERTYTAHIYIGLLKKGDGVGLQLKRKRGWF